MRLKNRRWAVLLALEAAGIVLAAGVLLALYANRDSGSAARSSPAQASPVQIGSLPGASTTLAPTASAAASLAAATSLAAPTASLPSETLSPAPTQTATSQPSQYTLQAGDTLSEVAARLGISLADLLAANLSIADPNLIQAGQVLNLPAPGGEPVAADLPAAGGAITATLKPYTALISVLGASQERVDAAYPASQTTAEGRLVVHYQPGAYVSGRLSHALALFSQAYLAAEDALGGPFGRPLHLYAAGSLFYANEDLRGFTQSGLYRSFILVDGTGNDGERAYYAAHELTHIFAYHRLGRPAGAMLQEGLATFVPHRFLSEAGGYLSLSQTCAAALAAGHLTPLAELAAAELGRPYFAGHTNNFIQYHQSACFVQYLIDTYGWDQFGQVYSSGEFQSVYGKALGELEREWLGQLQQVSFSIDPARFVQVLDQVAGAYRDYYARCTGGRHANWQAYLALDQARLAAYAGRLDEALDSLSAYADLIVR